MTKLDKTNTLVIVPAFNEQDSIVSVIEEIKETGYPFVVIDDGSTDETRVRAISAGARTITLPCNAGVGGALRCGFQYAVGRGFDAVIQCDADGQHPTEGFESLIRHANFNSAQFVVGNRFGNSKGNMKVASHRRFAMRLLSTMIYARTRRRVLDTTSGFRLISKPLLNYFAEEFPRHYLGDTYEALVISAQHGIDVYEIDVPFSNRTHGRSSSSNLRSVGRIVQLLISPIIAKSQITKQNQVLHE